MGGALHNPRAQASGSLPAMRPFIHALASILLLAGCQRSEPSGTAAATTAAPQKVATATAAATAAPATTATAAAPAATVAPTAEAAAEPPPSAKDWETAKEINVSGSTALGCETKRVRNWVRVHCAKPNDAEGTPVSVKLKKAEVLGAEVRNHRKDVTLSSEEGETTLVARYVEGVDVEAVFKWTDRERLLVLWWPAGKAEPASLGSFRAP